MDTQPMWASMGQRMEAIMELLASQGLRTILAASLRRRHLKHEGRYTADGLVEHQRPRERRLGALAAIRPLAQPAIDADRNRLRLVEIEAGRIDEPRRVFQLAAEPDGIARLRLTIGHDGAVHGLGDREIARTVRQLDDLRDQAVGRLESRMHVPERTGTAELRERKRARGEALRDVAGAINPQHEKRNAARVRTLQGGEAMADLLEPGAEAMGEQCDVVAERFGSLVETTIGHDHGGGEIVGERDAEEPPRRPVKLAACTDDLVDLRFGFRQCK